MIISNENQEKALIFFLQRPESISMRARLLLCAKRLRPLFSTWLTARHCCSVRGYWGEGGRWERRHEEDERNAISGKGRRRSWRTNQPPPRWHRWIYAGRTAEAPRGLSGCNFSSAAASDHRLPEQVLNNVHGESNNWIATIFLDSQTLYLDCSSDNDSAKPLDALMDPSHCCVCPLKVKQSLDVIDVQYMCI